RPAEAWRCCKPTTPTLWSSGSSERNAAMRLRVSLFLTALLTLGAACGSGPAVDTRTFELKYLRGPEAAQIISPYVYADRREAKGMMSFAGTTITVRETPDNLDESARVPAQYDRPRPRVRSPSHLIPRCGTSTL